VTTQSVIEAKLSVLNPEYLEVLNESHNHSVPENSETHFKVTIVTDQFDGARAVKRHQMVYGVLANELQSGVHALAIHAYTPIEWKGTSPDSPNCLGGSATEK
jgi:BolA protein